MKSQFIASFRFWKSFIYLNSVVWMFLCRFGKRRIILMWARRWTNWTREKKTFIFFENKYFICLNILAHSHGCRRHPPVDNLYFCKAHALHFVFHFSWRALSDLCDVSIHASYMSAKEVTRAHEPQYTFNVLMGTTCRLSIQFTSCPRRSDVYGLIWMFLVKLSVVIIVDYDLVNKFEMPPTTGVYRIYTLHGRAILCDVRIPSGTKRFTHFEYAE